MKNLTKIALALCCLCCLVTAAHPRQSAGEKGAGERTALLSVGEAAPDWTLKDARGKTHSLSEYRGKVVVLDFWATWCGPCAKVMPRMERLHRKYGAKGVVVFGVDSWDTGNPVAAMSKRSYTYTLLLKGEEMAPSYGVTSLPAVYAIGMDGRVIYSHAGTEHKNLDEVIEKHLAGQAAQPGTARAGG